MLIGTFRHQVNIEQQQQLQDSTTGEIVIQWVLFAKTLANIQPVRGYELQRAEQTTTRTLVNITIRYRDGVLPSMRVRTVNGQIYNIESVMPDGASGHEFITLACSIGVNAG